MRLTQSMQDRLKYLQEDEGFKNNHQRKSYLLDQIENDFEMLSFGDMTAEDFIDQIGQYLEIGNILYAEAKRSGEVYYGA